MEFGGASSLVLLLAIALWVAYLVPSLVRRQNFLATERNAVRLQQTIRALAETAEVDEEVHADASTSGVAEQQRRLKRAQKAAKKAAAKARSKASTGAGAGAGIRADSRAATTASSGTESRRRMQQASAEARDSRVDPTGTAWVAEAVSAARTRGAVAGEAAVPNEHASLLAETSESLRERDDAAARAAAATRRGRLLTTVVLVAGLSAAVGGGWLAATGGGWMLLASGIVAVIAAVAMLQQLGRVAASQRAAGEKQAASSSARPVPQVAAPAFDLHDHIDPAEAAPAPSAETGAQPAAAAAAGWQPIAVPKPLYLLREQSDPNGGPDGPGGPGGPGGPDGPGSGPRFTTYDLEALREAARASEQALRDAHDSPGVVTFGRIGDRRRNEQLVPVGESQATADRQAAYDAATPDAEPNFPTDSAHPDMQATEPMQREALAEAVHLEAIQAPPGRVANRPSRWERMGIVEERDAAAESPVVRRRRAS